MNELQELDAETRRRLDQILAKFRSLPVQKVDAVMVFAACIEVLNTDDLIKLRTEIVRRHGTGNRFVDVVEGQLILREIFSQ